MRALPLALLAITIAACGGVEELDDELAATDDGAAADALSGPTGAYYLVRADDRKCMYPMCGGYFVRQANKTTTKCPTGETAAECYVAGLNFLKLGATADQAIALRGLINADPRADVVLRGKLTTMAVLEHGRWGSVEVTEAFVSDAPAVVTGAIYRVSTTGQNCSFYPCETVQALKVNGSTKKTVHELTLGGSTLAKRDAALLGAFSPEGVVVAGTLVTSGRGASAHSTLTATQRFIRWTPPAATSRACGVALDEALSVAADGLLFTSESDYPFDFVEYPGAVQATLSNARFLQLAGLPANTAVETRTVAQFFRWIARDEPGMTAPEQALAARYRLLRRTLEQHLTSIKVFRTGQIEVGVHLIGRTACGDLAGLRTTSIET